MSHIKGLKLIYRGWIQPSEQSVRYRVEIVYEPWNSPEIRILEPEIEASPSTHIYSNRNICLYDWREQQWQKGWHLHETIIPWMAEWLVFYELFLMTGKWLGISSMHGTEKSLEPRVADHQD
ncbi:MAG: hypothetical protein WBD99_03625 [Thermodesulfobacteriota bacterium]